MTPILLEGIVVMATSYTFTKTALYLSGGGGGPNFQEVWNSHYFTSGKANGQFVTFPDGSKFRRATSQSKSFAKWSGSSGQMTSGSSGSTTYSATSSAGGWAPDLLSSLCPTITSGIGNPGKLNSPATTPVAMSNEAATKALLKLADNKANLGESLATFRQTVNLIRNPAGALLGSLKSAWSDRSLRPYLSRSIRSLRKEGIPKRISDKYLEYVYGWLPLMSDIHGIVELAKQQGVRPLLLEGRGSSSQQGQHGTSTYNNFSSKCITTVDSVSCKGTVRCNIWGRIDPNAAGLRALNQLGLLNPVSLAWDLVPWSFVVDWFVPIGNVLQALTAPAGLIFVDGTISAKWTMNGSFTNRFYLWDVANTKGSPATGLVEHRSWRRDTLNNWPMPGFYLSADPFAGDRSIKALALAISNLRNLR